MDDQLVEAYLRRAQELGLSAEDFVETIKVRLEQEAQSRLEALRTDLRAAIQFICDREGEAVCAETIEELGEQLRQRREPAS